jgi:hypothetical protein
MDIPADVAKDIPQNYNPERQIECRVNEDQADLGIDKSQLDEQDDKRCQDNHGWHDALRKEPEIQVFAPDWKFKSRQTVCGGRT